MKKIGIWMMAALTAWGSLTAEGAREKRDSEVITIFAAASLTNVMEKAEKFYEAEYPVDIRVNTASSSVLARQIESGAEADIFLSANVKWMNYLVEAGLISREYAADIAVNRIVLIIPAGNEIPEPIFSKDYPLAETFSGRLSLGDPDHVPAGIYAREALISLGWFEPLTERLLPAANVRAALMAVESGEVEMGVVYSTDAAVSSKVTVAGIFPAETHSSIRYQGGLVPDEAGEYSVEAGEFMVWFTGPAGQKIFTSFGFGLAEGP